MDNATHHDYDQSFFKLKQGIDDLEQIIEAGLHQNQSILINGYLETINDQLIKLFMRLTAPVDDFHDDDYQAQLQVAHSLMHYFLDVIANLDSRINHVLLAGQGFAWTTLIQKITTTKKSIHALQLELPAYIPISATDIDHQLLALYEYIGPDGGEKLAQRHGEKITVGHMVTQLTDKLAGGYITQFHRDISKQAASSTQPQAIEQTLQTINHLLFHRLLPLKLRLDITAHDTLPNAKLLAGVIAEATQKLLTLQEQLVAKNEVAKAQRQITITQLSQPTPVKTASPSPLLNLTIINNIITSHEAEFAKLTTTTLSAHAKKCGESLADLQRYYDNLHGKFAHATQLNEMAELHQQRRYADSLYKRLITQYDKTIEKMGNLHLSGVEALHMRTELQRYQALCIQARESRKAVRMADRFIQRLQLHKAEVHQVVNQLSASKRIGNLTHAAAFIYYQRLTNLRLSLQGFSNVTQRYVTEDMDEQESSSPSTTLQQQRTQLQTELDDLIADQIQSLAATVHSNHEFIRYAHYKHELRLFGNTELLDAITDAQFSETHLSCRLAKCKKWLTVTTEGRNFFDIGAMVSEGFDLNALCNDIKQLHPRAPVVASFEAILQQQFLFNQIQEFTNLLDNTVLTKIAQLRTLASHEYFATECLEKLSPNTRRLFEEIIALAEHAYAVCQQLQMEIKTFLQATHDLENPDCFKQVSLINFSEFFALCARSSDLQTQLNAIDKNDPDCLVVKRFIQNNHVFSVNDGIIEELSSGGLQNLLIPFTTTPMRFALFDLFKNPEKIAALQATQQQHLAEVGNTLQRQCQLLNNRKVVAEFKELYSFIQSQPNNKDSLGDCDAAHLCSLPVQAVIRTFQLQHVKVENLRDIRITYLPLQLATHQIRNDLLALKQDNIDQNNKPQTNELVEEILNTLTDYTTAFTLLAKSNAILQYQAKNKTHPAAATRYKQFCNAYEEFQQQAANYLTELREVVLPNLHTKSQAALQESSWSEQLSVIINRELRHVLHTQPFLAQNSALDFEQLTLPFNNKSAIKNALAPIANEMGSEFNSTVTRIWAAEKQEQLIVTLQNELLQKVLRQNPGLNILQLTQRQVARFNQGLAVTPNSLEKIGIQVSAKECREINMVQAKLAEQYHLQQMQVSVVYQLEQLQQEVTAHQQKCQNYFTQPEIVQKKRANSWLGLLRRLFGLTPLRELPPPNQATTNELLKAQPALLEKVGKLYGKLKHENADHALQEQCKQLFTNVYALQSQFVSRFPKQTQKSETTLSGPYCRDLLHKPTYALVVSHGFNKAQETVVNANLNSQLPSHIEAFIRAHHATAGKQQLRISGYDPVLVAAAKQLADSLAILIDESNDSLDVENAAASPQRSPDAATAA